ncbi:hypothetical protein [Iodidimonas sp. SYSU 1G8]|uniref:hypothetical protein n=1 Tax=Iodidimonas sp. SYSU 1G8 TaxID=3133967 RepID=UPI0031FE67B0
MFRDDTGIDPVDVDGIQLVTISGETAFAATFSHTAQPHGKPAADRAEEKRTERDREQRQFHGPRERPEIHGHGTSVRNGEHDDDGQQGQSEQKTQATHAVSLVRQAL